MDLSKAGSGETLEGGPIKSRFWGDVQRRTYQKQVLEGGPIKSRFQRGDVSTLNFAELRPRNLLLIGPSGLPCLPTRFGMLLPEPAFDRSGDLSKAGFGSKTYQKQGVPTGALKTRGMGATSG